MRKLIRRTSKKAGLPPGSLVHVGERRIETPRITIMDYDAEGLSEREASAIEECFPFRDTPTVTWINVCGIHDIEILRSLGQCYQIHPLVLEDILNTEQRPKLESFGSHLFVTLKMLHLHAGTAELSAEHISFLLGPNFVISFQETPEDVFETIRQSLRANRGRLRAQGPDYLAYALLDAIVDGYFVVLERLAEEIEEVEGRLMAEPSAETLHAIYRLKRELVFLRRSVWPLREIVNILLRRESELVRETTLPYLRDVYDHTVQVMDTTESLREVIAGMHDAYLSGMSNRMNEVMKVLTIIATLFIPLTFIAGVYGMNFRHMPELAWHWSYPAVWGVMAVVGLAMIAYFRRKRWL